MPRRSGLLLRAPLGVLFETSRVQQGCDWGLALPVSACQPAPRNAARQMRSSPPAHTVPDELSDTDMALPQASSAAVGLGSLGLPRIQTKQHALRSAARSL